MTKDKAITAIKSMPEEFEVEDLIEKLIVVAKINEGLRAEAEGKVKTHDEVKKIVSKW
jgi:predicted transcriptional regulator